MRHPRQSAFTLVELLVVIGILALLIALLLPALSRVQRSSRTIACAANLRTIAQAMLTYANDHDGAIVGGPHTSGAHLVRPAAPPINEDNCPAVSQIWDWQAPLARIMGVKFNEGADKPSRIERFNQLVSLRAFRCPDNDILATPFQAPGWPTIVMNSYNTAMVFHLLHSEPGGKGQAYGVTHCREQWNAPEGYAPKITKVGPSSTKIFIADGARYSTMTTPPDYDPTIRSSHGGAYSDQGAFTKFSRSWDRGLSPGNGGAGVDARLYAYRHGHRTGGGAANLYRFNAAFFDGHVETLGDLEGANPQYWVPRGTQVQFTPDQMYPDVLDKYGRGTTGMVVMP